jgi:hypothetical protein
VAVKRSLIARATQRHQRKLPVSGPSRPTLLDAVLSIADIEIRYIP